PRVKIADRIPRRIRFRLRKVVARGRVRPPVLRQRPHFHPRGDRAGAVDYGPAVYRPGNWRQECLTAQVMSHATRRPKTEEYSPPTAVMRLDKIGMPGSLNRAGFEVPMRQNRVT